MPIDLAITSLRFSPLIPFGVIAALAVAALLVVGFGLYRRSAGILARLAAFAILLAWLSGPYLVQEVRENLSDIGVIVMDASASMKIGDRARIAEAAQAQLLSQAGRHRDLDMRTVVVPESGRSGTRLFTDLDRVLADIPRARLAGIVMITDGQVHDMPAAVPGNIPLHVLIPARREEVDRRLRILEAPGYGIVGKSVTIRAVIEDLGVSSRNATAHMTLRRDGEPPVVENVPVGREHSFELPITRAGRTLVELSTSPLKGEVSRLNNRAVVEINGVRNRLRVLLISGEPHAGERTWRRLLKSDPSVDLVHFTILRPPEKDDLTPLNELALIAFPVRELFQEKIGDFDLIVLDRFQNRGLLPPAYLGNIATRVRQGGGLLLTVGPEFAGPTSLAAMPLARVLPGVPAGPSAIVDGKYHVALSRLGLSHPITEPLAGTPNPKPGQTIGGAWYRYVRANQVRGDALMEAPNGQPLLVLDRVEKGRVAMLLSDQIWLWSRGHDGGGPYSELMRRLAHWLVQEPDLEENTLIAHAADGQLTIEQRSQDSAAAPAVVVTDPDGKTETVPTAPQSPGRATAHLPATVPGVWQIGDGVRQTQAGVEPSNPAEIADLRATATVLAPLARASGGSTHWLGDVSNLAIPELRRVESGRNASGASWIGLERRHDHQTTGVSVLLLILPWPTLLLVMAVLLAGWRRESE